MPGKEELLQKQPKAKCPGSEGSLSLERVAVADLRDYRQCAEVLFDLGLCQVRVVSNNPLKRGALEEAGLKIVERVSIQVTQPEQAGDYLRTKKEKLGHLLDFSAG